MDNLLIKKLKDYGLHLLPINVKEVNGHKVKKPVSKKFYSNGKTEWHWKLDPETKEHIKYSDDELLKANNVGISHEAVSHLDGDGMLAVDGDFEECSDFMSELPETFTVGKKLNGSFKTRQKIYFVRGHNVKPHQFKHGGDVVIEQLTKTMSWIWSEDPNDRTILTDMKPTLLKGAQLNYVLRTIKKINAWSVLSKLMVPTGTRDQFYLCLAGVLARETDFNVDEAERFVEVLATRHGENVRKVIEKIKRQYENLKADKNVYGVKQLSEMVGSNLPCIDDLKDKPSYDGQLTTLKLGEFFQRTYPPIEHLCYPLLAKEKIVQVYANAGNGKTWFCLEAACCLANGQDFLKYKWTKDKEPHPVLYVEAEMSATELQDRLGKVFERYSNKGKEFNTDLFYIAPLKEQPDENFHSINTEIGRSYVENTANRIFKETGKKPFIFLDNISMLTNIQEKEGADWVLLMQWMVKLRSRGFTIWFLHHATKKGDTSSGSNFKERAIDVSIKLAEPADEFLDPDLDNHLQIIVNFDKWREFKFTGWSRPFIAALKRSDTTWSHHLLLSKNQRKVYELWKEGMDKKDIVKAIKKKYDLSQSQIYKLIAMFEKEKKENEKLE